MILRYSVLATIFVLELYVTVVVGNQYSIIIIIVKI